MNKPFHPHRIYLTETWSNPHPMLSILPNCLGLTQLHQWVSPALNSTGNSNNKKPRFSGGECTYLKVPTRASSNEIPSFAQSPKLSKLSFWRCDREVSPLQRKAGADEYGPLGKEAKNIYTVGVWKSAGVATKRRVRHPTNIITITLACFGYNWHSYNGCSYHHPKGVY